MKMQRVSLFLIGLAVLVAAEGCASTRQYSAFAPAEMTSAVLAASLPEQDAVDYMARLMDVWKLVEARYQTDLSPETRAIAEAYADGVNHYAALHPEQVLPGVIPATGEDVVAGFVFRTPMFYGFQRHVLALFDDEGSASSGPRQGQLALEMLPGTDLPLGPIGSNGIAVGPTRSADGATRLLINSHQPYTGPVAWYEVRLKSEEGWDMAGGVFPGSPLILHGHNRHLGWASTVNRPDLVDVYLLEINPENQNQYRFDGEWRDLEVGEAEIGMRIFGRLRWTVKRELLRSVHGPVIRREHGTYALRYAGMDEIRQLEQYYRLGKARNFDEWRAAMAMQALPSINYAYADREGEETERVVRPLALYFWGRAWTVGGWCELREDFRNFRLDRIASLEVTADTFELESPVTLEDYQRAQAE